MISSATLNAWADRWAALVQAGLVDATVVLIFLGLLWLLLRRWLSPQAGYWLFLLVLVKLLVPLELSVAPDLANWWPANAVAHLGGSAARPDCGLATAETPAAMQPDVPRHHPDRPAAQHSGERQWASEANPATPVEVASPAIARPAPMPRLSLRAKLMCGWVVVVVGLFIGLAWMQWRFARVMRRAVPLDKEALPAPLERLREWAGLRRPVPVVTSPAVSSPATCGLLRPKIVLPADLATALNGRQLSWVLLHELHHVRRRDLWVVMLQRVVQILYFFSPAVWIANWLIHRQREYACDDSALATCGLSRRECGRAFLAVLERACATPAPFSTLGFLNPNAMFRRRLMRLLDPRRPLRPRLSAASMVLLAVVALAVLPYIRAEQPVRPGSPVASQTDRAETDGARPPVLAGLGEPVKFAPYPSNLYPDAGEVWSIAISSDGTRLATGGGRWNLPGEVRVWDPGRRKLLASFSERTGALSVAFSADGKRLASVGSDRVVRIRDAETLKELVTLEVNGPARLAFSPDRNMLATATEREEVRLWDAKTGRPIATLEDNPFRYHCVCFSPDGKLLAAAGGNWGRDGQVNLWDVKSRKLVRTEKEHARSVLSVAFSSDGKVMAAGDCANVVLLTEASSGKLIMELQGHAGWVECVTFAPDGKSLVTASHDGTVKFWNLANGALIDSVAAHDGILRAVAFFPDRTMFATGGYGQTVKLWNTKTREQTGVLKTDNDLTDVPSDVLAVAYSPDGGTIASAGEDRRIRLRDAKSGRLKQVLNAQPESAIFVAFSPDGKTLATADLDGAVQLWDVARGDTQPRKVLKGHSEPVSSVAFSPDGKVLASSSADTTVRLWDAASGNGLAVLEGHPKAVCRVVFSPDGRLLASGSADGSVILWDAGTRKLKATLDGHEGAVLVVGFSPDGKTLAGAGESGSVILWDLPSGKERRRFLAHEGNVWSLAFSAGGENLATGGFDDGTVKVWNPVSGKLRRKLEESRGRVTSLAFAPDTSALVAGTSGKAILRWRSKPRGAAPLATIAAHRGSARFALFSPDGRKLLTGGHDRLVKIWDLRSGRLVRTLAGHERGIAAGELSPDGTVLATGSWNGTIRLWRVQTQQSLAILKGHKADVSALAFTPDGKILASGSWDRTARLWDVPGRRQIKALPEQPLVVMGVAVSPDGKTLATVTGDHRRRNEPGEVKLWALPSGKELATLPNPGTRFNTVRFSPDGKLLAYAGADCVVRLWDPAAGAERSALSLGYDAYCLAFDPPGQRLAAGEYDGAVSLWDVGTGRLYGVYEGHRGNGYGAGFSPDGTLLATAGGDGTVKLWPTSTAPADAESSAGLVRQWSHPGSAK